MTAAQMCRNQSFRKRTKGESLTLKDCALHPATSALKFFTFYDGVLSSPFYPYKLTHFLGGVKSEIGGGGEKNKRATSRKRYLVLFMS